MQIQDPNDYSSLEMYDKMVRTLSVTRVARCYLLVRKTCNETHMDLNAFETIEDEISHVMSPYSILYSEDPLFLKESLLIVQRINHDHSMRQKCPKFCDWILTLSFLLESNQERVMKDIKLSLEMMMCTDPSECVEYGKFIVVDLESLVNLSLSEPVIGVH